MERHIPSGGPALGPHTGPQVIERERRVGGIGMERQAVDLPLDLTQVHR